MRRVFIFALVCLPGLAQAACPERDEFLAELHCLEEDYRKADDALNTAWPKVLADPPSGGDRDAQRNRIRTAQRAWIAFRDADCEAVADTGIPKYWRYNYLSCLILHTENRTKDLLETYGQ